MSWLLEASQKCDSGSKSSRNVYQFTELYIPNLLPEAFYSYLTPGTLAGKNPHFYGSTFYERPPEALKKNVKKKNLSLVRNFIFEIHYIL